MQAENSLSTLRFPARADQLKLVRQHIIKTLERTGCTETETDQIVLAVNEACMNVIQHGYGQVEKDEAGEIILEILNAGTDVIFRIIDFAETVDQGEIKPRDLTDIRPGGLGMHFMQEIMDTVEFIDREPGGGNLLELRKSIQSRSK